MYGLAKTFPFPSVLPKKSLIVNGLMHLAIGRGGLEIRLGWILKDSEIIEDAADPGIVHLPSRRCSRNSIGESNIEILRVRIYLGANIRIKSAEHQKTVSIDNFHRHMFGECFLLLVFRRLDVDGIQPHRLHGMRRNRMP